MTQKESQKVREAMGWIGTWMTHCDYRAEPDLQAAYKILQELVHKTAAEKDQ